MAIDVAELLGRLRAKAVTKVGFRNQHDRHDMMRLDRGTIADAADTLESQQARIEALEADGIHSCGDFCQRTECVLRRRVEALEGALRPFAEACAHLNPSQPDDGVTLDGFEARDFRRAADTLHPGDQP